VVHSFQIVASAAAARPLGLPGDSDNAYAEALIDSIISIDPDAEFETGQRFADFYSVSVSENIDLPEPTGALPVALALTTLGLRRRAPAGARCSSGRKFRADRPVAAP